VPKTILTKKLVVTATIVLGSYGYYYEKLINKTKGSGSTTINKTRCLSPMAMGEGVTAPRNPLTGVTALYEKNAKGK
jgi:hypothetical protein